MSYGRGGSVSPLRAGDIGSLESQPGKAALSGLSVAQPSLGCSRENFDATVLNARPFN
jgi:hypothetical protein